MRNTVGDPRIGFFDIEDFRQELYDKLISFPIELWIEQQRDFQSSVIGKDQYLDLVLLRNILSIVCDYRELGYNACYRVFLELSCHYTYSGAYSYVRNFWEESDFPDFPCNLTYQIAYFLSNLIYPPEFLYYHFYATLDSCITKDGFVLMRFDAIYRVALEVLEREIERFGKVELFLPRMAEEFSRELAYI